MLARSVQVVLSLFFGCLACIFVTSVHADGRVFVLDLKNSSGPLGFRDAERACASHHARLASAPELRHAVLECFFSPCTRGWLYGGTVGTTVCNIVGGALKAVDVKTENATEDTAHLSSFCIKDKDVPCGDPPSFPNARLHGHTGFEMGDELLYTCAPGYVMPSGQSAFSLLCDSCGEWYGLVQICVKGDTESHMDYEDKFTDSYGEAERQSEDGKPAEAQGEVYEEVHGEALPEGKWSQGQQETSFNTKAEEEHRDQRGEEGVIGGKFDVDLETGDKDKERTTEDFVGHPTWEGERREEVRTDAAAATEPPVSILSQKHLFWFPSEAFQQEGRAASVNPVTQATQRASGAQSEESKEQESQERHRHQRPVNVDLHKQDTGGEEDHHDDGTDNDSRHDDEDDRDSNQDQDDGGDHVGHYVPAQHDHLDRLDRYEDRDDHDDHYDMGEHEDERVRYSSQDYDDRDDTYDEHESYEDHEGVTDSDDHREHPGGSEEHPDQDHRDDGEEHDEDNSDHIDHEHDDHDSYDSREDDDVDDDGHQRVIFSIERDAAHNVTQKGAGQKTTTDETWLDGYPVAAEETTERARPEEVAQGTVVRVTDTPNKVDKPDTGEPGAPESPTADFAQEGVGDEWPGSISTVAPSVDHPEPSDSPSYSDTLEYDTQQAAPTLSWLGDLTEHPFLDHGPAPPVHDGDTLSGVMDEETARDLPGETGERGEVEGEMGETICTGENCPPPSSSSRGPTVVAIIAAVCVVAAAIVVGVWCYRRQQQKSSVYEMNGKGLSQTRQGQQIEMQQKV
ncbi:uncharacterized protein susd5 [Aulostomus maculatus]